MSMYQRSLKTQLRAVTSVSSNISQRLRVSSDLSLFASGQTSKYFPRTMNEYQQYRRYMHDILCLSLISMSIYEDESLTLDKLDIRCNDPKLLKQVPDLYSVDGQIVRVCEVSLTYDMSTTESSKNEKYVELFSYIESNSNYQVQYKTLLVDLTDPEWVDNIPTLPDQYSQLLERFVENLVVFHATSDGDSMRRATSQNIDINFPFSYNKASMYQEFHEHLSLEEDLSDSFNIYSEGFGKIDLGTQQVSDYMEELVDCILSKKPHPRPFPCNEPVEPTGFLKDWETFKKRPSTKKPPVVLQLGSPSLTDETDTMTRMEVFNSLTESTSYGGYLDLIKSSNTTLDEFLESGIIKLSLSESQLDEEMKSGPGRKKYMRQHGITFDRSEPTHLSPTESHIESVNELMDKFNNIDPSQFVKRKHRADYNVCGNNLGGMINRTVMSLSSCGVDFLLQFYSRLSTEIILNSMKRRKQRQYVMCHSGFDGVFFLVAPGPQLRTESNVEFIKILSFVEPIVHELSRPWIQIGDHWESDWLSVDTDRLKHWVRSRDRVNLSIMGCAEKLVTTSQNFDESLTSEILNSNYSLMAMIYLENKSSTSTTIQTTRYVMMKSLGDKQLDGLFSKFPERNSSVLQSLVMIRMVNYARLVCQTKTTDFLKQSSVKRDENVGTLDETTTGVVGSVPRIFTSGDFVPIQYSINEIYWCMMYNKDRQNQTQDAMKILKKIAKEERKLDEEFDRRDGKARLAHAFGFHRTSEDIKHIKSDKPESHYYSCLAVSIGVALQDCHKENFSPNGSWITNVKLHEILNKNLSDYATFKASVKTIKDEITADDYKELSEIGRRTKCIELIHEMVTTERVSLACEIAMQFAGNASPSFKTVIQIFKKNQVGGVREILILFIKARVLINLVEELSRLMSKSDKRETLTKGKDKRLMMRGDYEELSSSFPEGTPLYVVKNSYDMATWCQKFIPTIFLPLHNHHHAKLGDMIQLCRMVLLKHCHKEIEYPRKLVEQWIKHPAMKHDESHLQYYKEKFLKDRQPKMKNFSNMGQGILHYDSTALALSCQSLRDELFRRCLKKLGKPMSIKWKTRVGSDDKGDTIMGDMTSDDYVFQMKLFEQCALAAERLHAMDLSVKSASGTILYEFNSAYMANLEVQSPVIKFSLSAVDMIGTSSCSGFVNESYSRIRQLRENGASSLLCYMSHVMNKVHFEDIFRTGQGMTNDPTKIFNLPQESIPFDLGIYPIYDADMQDMVGPEFHNYNVFMNPATPNKILNMNYTTSFSLNDNLIESQDDDPSTMYKKTDMSISQGMVRQLTNMRERLNLDRDEINKYLETNPFLIIRGPVTVDETAILIAAKLYTRGAATSLRRTSPAIYIGRLTAFESARAWNHFIDSETDKPIRMTYKEYMETLYQAQSNDQTNVREMKTLIFPQYNSFEVVKQYINVHGMRKPVTKMFSQSIRTWILNNFNYNFSSSLKSIMETAFGFTKSASTEDVQELRKVLPYNIDTMSEFISDCNEKNVRPLDVLMFTQRFYKTTQRKVAQVFATGPSTSSLNLTLMNLKRYNHIVGSVMDIDPTANERILEDQTSMAKDYELLKLGFNFCMLGTQGAATFEGSLDLEPMDCVSFDGHSLSSKCESIIRGIKSINQLDQQSRKIVIFLASKILDKSEFRSKLVQWKQLSYTYIKTQKRTDNGTWYGDLHVIVNYANECYTLNITSGYHYVECFRILDTNFFIQSLRKMCKILGLEFQSFFTMSNLQQGDYYLSNKSIFISNFFSKNKTRLNLQQNPTFRYQRLNDISDFTICYKTLPSGATVISMSSRRGGSIDVAHYPGHYYPTEVPRGAKVDSRMFINGLRSTILFKNRKWFFDGRLHPFTRREAVNVLKRHIRVGDMNMVDQTTKTKLQEYAEEYEEAVIENMNQMEDPSFGSFEEPLLYKDLEKQNEIFDNSMSFKEMFQKAADELKATDWADDANEELDLESFKEELSAFVSALGQNKQKKKREFFTITNLRLNQSFTNRIMDLFFRGQSIVSEDKHALPDYARHCLDVLSRDRNNTLVLTLYKYIIGRLSDLMVRDRQDIESKLNRLSNNFRTLPRLVDYLNAASPVSDFFAELDEHNYNSDSEEDFE
nr:RNA-dependent RNA polymerase [Erysiphe necator associated negative-stranded RNA virus 4]